MFIRPLKKWRNPEGDQTIMVPYTYYRLCESYREADGKVKQRTVLGLGELLEFPTDALKNDLSQVKTIYGFGSHYYLVKIPGVKIEQVSGLRLWCEVIHEKNMGNDAYFLHATMEKDRALLQRDFSIGEPLGHGLHLYLFRFLPRYAKTFVRRARNRIFGRKW